MGEAGRELVTVLFLVIYSDKSVAIPMLIGLSVGKRRKEQRIRRKGATEAE